MNRVYLFLASFLIYSCTIQYPVLIKSAGDEDLVPNTVKIITWNIGYAGLGAESDFISDGGTHLFPRSKEDVKKNLDGIKKQITGYDFVLIQEMAFSSNVNYFINVFEQISGSLAGYYAAYSAKVNMNSLFIKTDVGQALFSKYKPIEVFRYDLPAVNPAFFDIKQNYFLFVSRFNLQDNKRLTLINLHLSAFDKDAQLRYKQLQALKEFVLNEYSQGSSVIAAGDWNLVISQTGYSFTTKEKYLFWIFSFPPDFPPIGWQLVTGRDIPTVRTLERPYVKYENYTTSIDGYLLSPGVELIDIQTIDVDFQYSDHQPVVLSCTIEQDKN